MNLTFSLFSITYLGLQLRQDSRIELFTKANHIRICIYLHTLEYASNRFVSYSLESLLDGREERTNAFLTIFILHEVFNLNGFIEIFDRLPHRYFDVFHQSFAILGGRL